MPSRKALTAYRSTSPPDGYLLPYSTGSTSSPADTCLPGSFFTCYVCVQKKKAERFHLRMHFPLILFSTLPVTDPTAVTVTAKKENGICWLLIVDGGNRSFQ